MSRSLKPRKPRAAAPGTPRGRYHCGAVRAVVAALLRKQPQSRGELIVSSGLRPRQTDNALANIDLRDLLLRRHGPDGRFRYSLRAGTTLEHFAA